MANNVVILNHINMLDYAADTLRGVYLLLYSMTEQGSEIENAQLTVLADALNSAETSVKSVVCDLKAAHEGGGVV